MYAFDDQAFHFQPRSSSQCTDRSQNSLDSYTRPGSDFPTSYSSCSCTAELEVSGEGESGQRAAGSGAERTVSEGLRGKIKAIRGGE